MYEEVNLMIETNRLYIRQINIEDKDDIYKIFSLNEIAEPYGMLPIKDNNRLESFLSELIESKEHLIQKKSNREIIGTIGLIDLNKKCKRAEIGYGIMPVYWNQGYTTEALKAYINKTFCDTNLNRLEAFVHPENIYSCRILNKLGFTCEGLLKQRGFSKNKFQDFYLYRLLREEWSTL